MRGPLYEMSQVSIVLPSGPHAQSTQQVLAALGSHPQGLTRAEAQARLSRLGRNALPRAKSPGVFTIFLRQFLSPLIYILLFAAAISLLLGDWSDAGFILLVQLLNATIGAAQEFSAQRSSEALQQDIPGEIGSY